MSFAPDSLIASFISRQPHCQLYLPTASLPALLPTASLPAFSPAAFSLPVLPLAASAADAGNYVVYVFNFKTVGNINMGNEF